MQPPSRPSPSRSLTALFQHEFHATRLIPTLTAGLVTGILLIVNSISFAALIFGGDLTQYVYLGVGATLFTATIVCVFVALLSSLPGVVALPQDSPAIILALMASAIAAQLPISTSPTQTISTIVVAIALTSCLTGLFCFVLGSFKLGDLTRFMPYPVIGGFLAGTGWLLVSGSIGLMTDHHLTLDYLPELMQADTLIQWVPGLCLGILLFVLHHRYHSMFVLPGLILGAIALFYGALWATGTSLSEARDYHLLLEPFPSGMLWQPVTPATVMQSNWGAIGHQIGNMAAVALLTAIALLLNATSIELVAKRDMNLNRELRSIGLANIVAGLGGGGVVGFHTLDMSAINIERMGSKSRLVGLIAAAIGAIAMIAGASLLALFPKPVLGAITLFLGIDFLVEWLYDGWFKLSKSDYAIVLLILAVIGTVGYLEGIVIGLLVAITLFVISYSQIDVAKHTLSGETFHSRAAHTMQQQRILETEGNQIHILELQGFLFFGTANKLVIQIRQHLNQTPLRFVVFSFRLVAGLDSSAILSFTKLKQLAQQEGLTLVYTHLSHTIQKQLQQGGILTDDDPRCQVFPDLDRGIEWCETQILDKIPQRRRRSLPLALQLNELFTNPEHVSKFMSYLDERDVDAGVTLFSQGEAADTLFLIELGQVTLLQQGTANHTRRLQSLGAGNLVGDVDFFSQAPHQTSAIIDQPSTLYCLSYKAMQRMRHEQPDVATTFQEFVISLLRDRLTSTYKEVSDLLQ